MQSICISTWDSPISTVVFCMTSPWLERETGKSRRVSVGIWKNKKTVLGGLKLLILEGLAEGESKIKYIKKKFWKGYLRKFEKKKKGWNCQYTCVYHDNTYQCTRTNQNLERNGIVLDASCPPPKMLNAITQTHHGCFDLYSMKLGRVRETLSIKHVASVIVVVLGCWLPGALGISIHASLGFILARTFDCPCILF